MKELGDVVVIGEGAREHALVLALAESPEVRRIYAAPGNPGMETLAERVDARRPEDWVRLARDHHALTVVGPEVPLAAGLADHLRSEGLTVVGPGAAAARLESSKIFAKAAMQAAGIPTAQAVRADSAADLRMIARQKATWPLVIKEDGLAQGKGVTIVHDAVELDALLAARPEGPWLCEEFLSGRELSVEILTNGRDYVWLPPAVDHKRLSADPRSPNTGGMGAYAPVPWLTENDRQAIDDRVLQPLMRYLQAVGANYWGVLYAGLMMTPKGPYVLEFNVRFGDPEAEVVLPLIQDDLYLWFHALARGELYADHIRIARECAVAAVVASEGYPAQPQVGRPIRIGRRVPRSLIFHAATERRGGELVSRGGRVLTVVGIDRDFASARQAAYDQIGQIVLEGAQVRGDIAADL